MVRVLSSSSSWALAVGFAWELYDVVCAAPKEFGAAYVAACRSTLTTESQRFVVAEKEGRTLNREENANA
jgi:hypothetical protein